MSSSKTIPKDLTGRILQAGDFCIYTLNQWGGLNFGYVKEIKEVKGRYGGKTLRIKMVHTDRFGTVLKETNWDGATRQRIELEKDQETWLNYTYAERFLVTQPL